MSGIGLLRQVKAAMVGNVQVGYVVVVFVTAAEVRIVTLANVKSCRVGDG